MEKPPPAEQLNAVEYILESAQLVMEEAKQLSLEVADGVNNPATEDDHTAMRSFFDKMELEILAKVIRFKSLYPEMQRHAADQLWALQAEPLIK